MSADTLQQHEQHGRRWATALLAIGEPRREVRTDALKKKGMEPNDLNLHTPSGQWRGAALISPGWGAKQCAFLAGAFAACEESTL